MDEKTLGAIFIGIIYPVMVVVGLIGGILIYAYFLPERKSSSRRAEHRIRKY